MIDGQSFLLGSGKSFCYYFCVFFFIKNVNVIQLSIEIGH